MAFPCKESLLFFRVNTTEMLEMVRHEMTNINITILIIPLDEVGRLSWVSGFTGSNGEAVVTLDEGGLLTFSWEPDL